MRTSADHRDPLISHPLRSSSVARPPSSTKVSPAAKALRRELEWHAAVIEQENVDTEHQSMGFRLQGEEDFGSARPRWTPEAKFRLLMSSTATLQKIPRAPKIIQFSNTKPPNFVEEASPKDSKSSGRPSTCRKSRSPAFDRT